MYNNSLTFLSIQALPHDPKARRLFVTSGGLKKVLLYVICIVCLSVTSFYLIRSCISSAVCLLYRRGHIPHLYAKGEGERLF